MIAIIPARKGSKRLPGKNMMELCGKPLIYWTIQAALNAETVHSIIVSTDCKKIAGYSKKFCDVNMRPPELATDNAPMDGVLLDVLETINADYFEDVCCLQPTSPLRTSEDIDDAFSFCATIVSVTSVCGNIFRRNGAIYIARAESIYQRDVSFEAAYIMPPERSVDIDTIEDFKEAERYMNERNKL